MKSETLFNWIQIATGIAVLVGVVLVVWELRQSQDIAKAQMLTDDYNNNIQLFAAISGENVADILAKACNDPEALTSGEFVAFRLVNQALLAVVNRQYFVEEQTGISYTVWQYTAGPTFDFVLNSAAGRAWWKVAARALPPVREFGDSRLEAAGPPQCANQESAWREQVKMAVQST